MVRAVGGLSRLLLGLVKISKMRADMSYFAQVFLKHPSLGSKLTWILPSSGLSFHAFSIFGSGVEIENLLFSVSLWANRAEMMPCT